MNTARQLHIKKKDLITKILKQYPDSIEYPAYFNVLYWREHGFLTNLTPIEVESMRFAPSPESAPRIVRKQVQDGLIARSEKQTKRNAQLSTDSRNSLSKPIVAPQEPKKTRIVWDNKTNTGFIYS